MSTFKSLQVLRTKVATRVKDVRLPIGTRVVVIKHLSDRTVQLRVQDKSRTASAQKLRLVLAVNQLERTHRGRPRKDVKAPAKAARIQTAVKQELKNMDKSTDRASKTVAKKIGKRMAEAVKLEAEVPSEVVNA
jgi:hypothetical protein